MGKGTTKIEGLDVLLLLYTARVYWMFVWKVKLLGHRFQTRGNSDSQVTEGLLFMPFITTFFHYIPIQIKKVFNLFHRK